MGYYIQTGKNIGKAEYLIENYGAKEQLAPNSLSELSPDSALICVVDNGLFEAAGFVYDDDELYGFTLPTDRRFKRWLTMPLDKAKELSGYNL
jgi:hypothetical protein